MPVSTWAHNTPVCVHVSTQSLTVRPHVSAGVYAQQCMPTRRGKRTPRLAKKLEEYRQGRAWGEVAQAIQRFVPGTTRGTIRNYEVQARCPDISILWALCQVYRVDFGDVSEAMVLELLDREPTSPTPMLTVQEAELVDHFRAARLNPRSQLAMLAACEQLAKVQAHEDDVVG
jgi:hypothetical protein